MFHQANDLNFVLYIIENPKERLRTPLRCTTIEIYSTCTWVSAVLALLYPIVIGNLHPIGLA